LGFLVPVLFLHIGSGDVRWRISASVSSIHAHDRGDRKAARMRGQRRREFKESIKVLYLVLGRSLTVKATEKAVRQGGRRGVHASVH